ncbi:hypothetical protein D3C85_693260 [compost metagenome]
MSTAIAIYLAFGFLSFWPSVHFYLDTEELIDGIKNGKWHHWLVAHAVWTICWPYRYISDAWYWWRAKK